MKTVTGFLVLSTILSVPACGQEVIGPIRVNAGGAAYTDMSGQLWQADYAYSGTTTVNSTAASITGALNSTLYQSQRQATSSLTYQFSVPNGSYDVLLKFAEITASSDRNINVAIGGIQVAWNFSPLTACGRYTPCDQSFPAQVTAGQLTVSLTGSSPAVNAIQITPLRISGAAPGLASDCAHADGSTSQCAAAAFSDSETPVAGQSSNSFTLSVAPEPPSSLMLKLNGVIQSQDSDYTLSANAITFVPSVDLVGMAPYSLQASYRHAAPAAAVSVMPGSASGNLQTFALAYSEPRGFAAIGSLSALINSSLVTSGGCYVIYYPASATLSLRNDADSTWLGPIALGASATLQNSQCTVNGATSSAFGSGNSLTLNLALSFKTSFLGSKTVYMAANDGIDSGWQQKGSWNVIPAAPVSVTPKAGSGYVQTFSFLFSDTMGYTAISSASVIFNSSLSGAGGCYLSYTRSTNVLLLANDANTGWLTPVTVGQSGSVQNSQCTVNAGSSSVSGSGNTLTVNLALSFLSAFQGIKNSYMEVTDGTDSGWVQKGTWTVPGPPAPVSATPGSGTGSSQTFSLLYSDQQGYAAITGVYMIVNSSPSGVGGCEVLYVPGGNLLYLANDAATAWLTPGTLGQSGSLQNSQCTVNTGTSSVLGNGNNLTLNLAVSFLQAFQGAWNIYMRVSDGVDSGWVQKGTWGVPGVPPTLVSVTPGSGSGSSQTFSLLYSDTQGFAAISSAYMIVNSSPSGVGGCEVLYVRSGNLLYLANDAATAWLTPGTVGQSGSLQNSQCTVNTGTSSVSGSGNNLTLNLAVSFQSAFQGARNIYMDAFDGLDSGWVQKGTWTIP